MDERKATIQSGMEDLSGDIMFNIFSRLPLRSVIQCSCVSKSWLNIIKDPAFGKIHFYRSGAEPTPTLLILTRDVRGENIISISPLKYKDPVLRFDYNAISHISSPYSWNLVGTCDGLLCFASSCHEDVIMVCNPVTREHVILPRPTIPPSFESCEMILGFGLDLTNKKYKVVRIFYPKSLEIHIGTQVTAEVYTLGDTASWRRVQDFDCPPHGTPVYANGALHWLLHPILQHLPERIVSFDLETEEFRLTPHLDFGAKISLVELGGCLSVVDVSSATMIEVSVLKNPVENLWELEYIIPLRVCRGVRRCLGHGMYMESPTLICAHEQTGVLVIWLRDSLISYEQRVFRLRDVRLEGLPTWLDWNVCSGYRGSLVPLKDVDSSGDDRRDIVHVLSDTDI